VIWTYKKANNVKEYQKCKKKTWRKGFLIKKSALVLQIESIMLKNVKIARKTIEKVIWF
jgi:hypothetical protein